MEYRNHAGNMVSALGFGCMRFPTNPDGSINEPETRRMLDRAWERGVTYYDTAYPYHNGESERVVGRWLAGKPRDKVYLATKLPVFLIEKPEDIESDIYFWLAVALLAILFLERFLQARKKI